MCPDGACGWGAVLAVPSPRRSTRRTAVAAGVALLVLATCVSPSQAAFPGTDGPLAFSLNYDYYCGEGAAEYPCGDGQYAGINYLSLGSRNRTLEVRYGYEAAWSADGRRLAYRIPSSFNDDPGGGIWVARADGSQRRRLLRSGRDPVWSPAGRKLAFADAREVPDRVILTVATLDLETGRVRKIAAGQDPAWAVNGRLAYKSSGEGQHLHRGGIAVLSPRTGRKSPISAGPNDEGPDWSPSGRRVVFERAGGTSSIWIVGADGRGTRRLTSGSDPAWSPSGRWIAFCRGEGLYVVRPDGRGERRVLATGSFRPEADVKVTPTGPAWQPIH